VLRFEDLDPGPVRAHCYDTQRRDLAAIGLDWDDELRQHEHVERYRESLAVLEATGRVYPCFCTRRELTEAAAAPHGPSRDGLYPGTCRELGDADRAKRRAAGSRAALRIRADGAREQADDVLLGAITGVVDDLVLRRSDGVFAYHLVAVIDDAYQGVQQVVRADDLVPSTPAQRWLGHQLGVPPVSYAHVPLVLGPGGRRLAKRDGAVTLADRGALGESAAAVTGRLARSLGFPEPGPVTAADLLSWFDPAQLPRQPWSLTSGEIGPSVSTGGGELPAMFADTRPAARR
jgi:glutamyl-tRNA synthetase